MSASYVEDRRAARGATRDGRRHRFTLLAILGVALLVRLLLFASLSGTLELTADELQYRDIAVSLAEGRGFLLEGKPTSWRPPLYPAVMALVSRLTGTTDPHAVRILQLALSLVTVLLVYLLGRRLFGDRVGLIAAGIVAVYPSMVFYTHHLLTETLFTCLLLLTAFGFAAYVRTGAVAVLAATGVALGLTVLTRDSVWPMAGVMALLMGPTTGYRPRRWIGHAAGFLVAFLLITVPWVARNTQLQGTFTLIATNNGPGILAGNNEHTPSDRPWRYHGFAREQRWRGALPDGLTEGARQQLAFRKGIEFILDHPGLTLRRAVVKAANVWGLEREIVGTLASGVYGQTWRRAVVPVTIAVFGVYCVVLLSSLVGLSFALARPGGDGAFHLLVAALLVLVTAVHAVAFGHPRYHLPLVPLLCVYAARAWAIRREVWQARRSPAFMVSGVLGGLAVVIWLREILVEFGRIHEVLR